MRMLFSLQITYSRFSCIKSEYNYFPPAPEDMDSSDTANKSQSIKKCVPQQTCCTTLRSLIPNRAGKKTPAVSATVHPLPRQFEHLATQLRPSCNSSARSNHTQISFGLLASTEARRSGCNHGWTYPPKYHGHYVYLYCIVEICIGIKAKQKKKVMKQRLSRHFAQFFHLWPTVRCVYLSFTLNTGNIWSVNWLLLVSCLPNINFSGTVNTWKESSHELIIINCLNNNTDPPPQIQCSHELPGCGHEPANELHKIVVREASISSDSVQQIYSK